MLRENETKKVIVTSIYLPKGIDSHTLGHAIVFQTRRAYPLKYSTLKVQHTVK